MAVNDLIKKNEKSLKKLLTYVNVDGIINKRSRERVTNKNKTKKVLKKIKKVLDRLKQL